MPISEDDLADTFAPRLMVSGVNLTKVHFAMKTIVRDTAKRVERQIRGQRQFARSEQAHPSGLWRW